MIREFEGIIVTETPYGESSKILNILTKNDGIIGVIAKGSKRLKSKLRSGANKLTIGNFNVYYHKDKLSTLISVDVINPLSNIKTDIVKIGYLTYITELAYQTAKQNRDDTIYKILKDTIYKIEDNLDPKIMTNILEIKMLDFLGVSLNLDSCCKCGKNENLITIDGDAGGILCKDCRTNEMICDEKSIKMLKMYYYINIDSITELKISPNVVEDINRFLKLYYDRYTGLYLKSKKFLESIDI